MIFVPMEYLANKYEDYTRLARGLIHGFPQGILVQVTPAARTAARVRR